MNTFIFATFCDPVTLHFNLLSSSSSLSSFSYSHLLLFSAEYVFIISTSTVYYYFLFLPLSYLIIYSAFISSSICFYGFFSRFYSCLISFFHFYISFSSVSLFLHIYSPIPPSILSFLHPVFLLCTHHVLPLSLLCMHSNFCLLLPFSLLIIIVLYLFSSHRNTLSFLFPPVPYFPLLPCCKLKYFSYSLLDIRICCSMSPADISGLIKQYPRHGLYPNVFKIQN